MALGQQTSFALDIDPVVYIYGLLPVGPVTAFRIAEAGFHLISFG